MRVLTLSFFEILIQIKLIESHIFAISRKKKIYKFLLKKKNPYANIVLG